MKRARIAVIFLCAIILVSCAADERNPIAGLHSAEVNANPQTDLDIIPQSDLEQEFITSKNIQTVLYFSNYDLDAPVNEKLHDTLLFYNPLADDNKKAAFVKTYLQQQEIYKNEPDGTTYDNGKPFTEYYIDEEGKKICFIIHFWRDYTSDSETNETIFTDTIFCTTVHIDDMEMAGYVAREYDDEQKIAYEKMFNEEGKQTASFSYEYIKGISFPFVSNYEGSDEYKNSVNKIFNGEQKFWFYKDLADFDESGKLIGYRGDLYNPITADNDSESHYHTCFYDAEGRLETITEKLNQTDIDRGETWYYAEKGFSGEYKLSYRENGCLSAVEYNRSSVVHGTWDSSGGIEYDETGRMAYAHYYVTHGGHTLIYLYNGEEKRPWASVELCSMSYGGTDDEDVSYGNEVSVYLFRSYFTQ